MSQVEDALRVLSTAGITGPIDGAIVLGTGLGRLADTLNDAIVVPYTKVPGFPDVRIDGGEASVVLGSIEGKRILVLKGRAHYYNTGDPGVMRVPIAVLAALGAPYVVFTNAAGSVSMDIRPGNLALITDHINYAGINPLIGDTGRERFVSMADAYDYRLRNRMKRAAAKSGANLSEGVFMWFAGPSFETAAEVKMARLLGAALVGMSTVPEVIMARRHALKVVALSLVTSVGAGIDVSGIIPKDTRDIALASTMTLERLIKRFVTEPEHV